MHSAKSLAIKTAFNLVGKLPLSGVQAIGRFTGRCIWRIQGREAKLTMRNLELCFPQLTGEERRALARRSLMHTGMLGLEMAKVWSQPAEETLAAIQNADEKHQELKEIGRDRAVLIVAPHLGNWEVLNLFLGFHYPMNVLYQPPKVAELEDIIARAREQTGSRVFPTTQRGVAALFQALRKKQWVGILPDQEPDREGGVFAPFFGLDTLTMTLISKLAQKTRPAVVLVYAKRLADARGFELVVHVADQAIYSEDLQESVSALNAGVERCVRECIEQYQWEYKRFRRNRTGNTGYYDNLKKR